MRNYLVTRHYAIWDIEDVHGSHNSEDENPAIMKNLHKAIIKDAKTKGFTGATYTYEANNNIVTEIFTQIKNFVPRLTMVNLISAVKVNMLVRVMN